MSIKESESFYCCGYVNIKGLMCSNCPGWDKSNNLTFTKEENEKWSPDNYETLNEELNGGINTKENSTKFNKRRLLLAV